MKQLNNPFYNNTFGCKVRAMKMEAPCFELICNSTLKVSVGKSLYNSYYSVGMTLSPTKKLNIKLCVKIIRYVYYFYETFAEKPYYLYSSNDYFKAWLLINAIVFRSHLFFLKLIFCHPFYFISYIPIWNYIIKILVEVDPSKATNPKVKIADSVL